MALRTAARAKFGSRVSFLSVWFQCSSWRRLQGPHRRRTDHTSFSRPPLPLSPSLALSAAGRGQETQRKQPFIDDLLCARPGARHFFTGVSPACSRHVCAGRGWWWTDSVYSGWWAAGSLLPPPTPRGAGRPGPRPTRCWGLRVVSSLCT